MMDERAARPASSAVGQYRLIRPIGFGGMGTVFQAEHAQLGRRVALKFIRNQTPRTRARFEREARLLARLEHENIVGLLDIGIDEVRGPYLVLEYLAGRTLRQELDELGVRPLERVQSIVTEIGRGLSAAHRTGIVHRDLKPENVMLVAHADGSLLVKLLDFGVARCTSEDGASLTATDAALGTAAYMSPEQAAGRRRIDKRTDIYSLGVLVYECLAGRRPYQGESYNSTLFQILNRPHRPLAELRSDLPKSFVDAVERALSKRREDRQADVTELIAELTAAEASPERRPLATFSRPNTPTTSEAPELPVTRSRPRRRNSTLPIVLSLILGGALTACLARMFDPAANAPKRTPVSPSTAERVVSAVSPATERAANPLSTSGPESPPSPELEPPQSSKLSPPQPRQVRLPTPARSSHVSSSTPGSEPGASTSSARLRGYLTRNPYEGAEIAGRP